MSQPMPKLADFAIAESETKKLADYFAAFATRSITGLCIVASPDAKLRADLLYALLGKYAEVGGIEHSFEGGIITIERHVSYQTPPEDTKLQKEVEGGHYIDALNGAFRTSPDYILIDEVDAVEVAQAAIRGAASAFRIIGGMQTDSRVAVEEKLRSTAAPKEIIDEILDLVIVAKTVQDIQVSLMRSV